MRKDTLYYVETDRGCGIRAAQNLQQAHKDALKESGTAGFERIRKATKDDIEWVSGMGGNIPQT